MTSSGPRYAKTCIRVYADSEGPDQPTHPRILIRTVTICQKNHWKLADKVDVDDISDEFESWPDRIIFLRVTSP